MAPENDRTGPTSPASSSRKRARAAKDCDQRHTRAKLSPPTQGSSASEQSLSDESALIATSVPEELTDASEVDSDGELSKSSDDTSSGSSSEEESEEESEEDTVVNLMANRGKKPSMRLPKDDLAPDLRAHLAQFLPKLAAANEELEAQRKAGTLKEKAMELDDNEEAGQYIEMDLGLGVLEHKEPGAEDAPPDADSDNENILGKLMGREGKKDGVGIQEVPLEES